MKLFLLFVSWERKSHLQTLGHANHSVAINTYFRIPLVLLLLEV